MKKIIWHRERERERERERKRERMRERERERENIIIPGQELISLRTTSRSRYTCLILLTI